MENISELKIVGAIIRERREQLHLTLVDLENLTGIKISYLSTLERGKAKNPSIKHLNTVLTKLSLSKSEVWHRVEDIQKARSKKNDFA